jgi:hypothetical protein
MTVDTLPEYLHVSQSERGESFGIDFESYRRLATTALAIIQEESLTMGLYRVDGGAALDIFGRVNCLTILVDCAQKQLHLLRSPMDDGAELVCLLTADSSAPGWRKLLQIAREEIQV